jgi:3'-phosphoadenosine 5'-phosphosulfate (PAPS) 3'-phosphatase
MSRDRQYREAIWDQAAGALLIEEAGGRVMRSANNGEDSHGANERHDQAAGQR